MSTTTSPIPCDGDRDCTAPLAFQCTCARCSREPDDEERFHACASHPEAASAKHLRVRGTPAAWSRR